MAQTTLHYRLHVRNEDDTDDVVVLSSKPGDTYPLLCDPPDGDGQAIDPIAGTLEVGAYTWTAADRYDGGDVYAITSLLADEDARNQLLSHKCIAKRSIDGGTFTTFHTGYLNDIKLGDAATFTLIVGDSDRRERDAVLFKTITTQFDKVSNIIGGPVEAETAVAWQGTPTRAWGPIIDYGPARFVVIANPTGLVNPTNRVTLSLVSANLPPLYFGQMGSFSVKLPAGLKWSLPAEYIDAIARKYFEDDAEGLYKTDVSQKSQPWGSFPEIEIKLKAVSGGAITRTFPIAQAAQKRSASVIPLPGVEDWPLGDYQALVANSNDWLIAAWDTATMGAQPSVGTQFDVWVRPKVISPDNPLHIRGHPIDIHRLANTQEGIADDSTSAEAAKTALGALFYELWITEEWEYSKFTAMLKASAGYAVRYNGAGAQEFFVTRATQPAAVDTVTTADIAGDDRGEPQEIIFRVAEDTAIKGVDFKLKQFRLWSDKTDSESERPIDGIIADDVTITGLRRDDSVKGSRIVVYDVPGMIMLQGGSILFSQPLQLRNWIIAAGEVIIDRAGWGWAEGEIEVFASVVAKIGEYLNIEAPHQVNAKTGQDPIAQRGGTRKMQIVAATELPGTRRLKLKDAGNLAQDPPEANDDGIGADPNDGLPVPELSLAPSDDAPFTVATVTLDNMTDFDDLNADTLLEYLVQEATPASTDSGDSFGPLASSTGEDTIDAPAIEAGETIWVRGRARIAATGQLGAWSDWISITLGPDDEGEGGTLPPFFLDLQIDGSGVLSATASSLVAEITKVYFVAGPDTGAAPSFADVLAGTADASGPPFTAASLATMAEGETRTVGAIGEDALGNRTTLVLATITRGVDSGEAEGTPGNMVLTMHAGPAAVARAVDSAVNEPIAFVQMRKSANASKMRQARIELGNHAAASSGTEYVLLYSTNRFVSYAEAGPTVRADRVRFPETGEYMDLVEAARVDGVMFGLGTKGGDGTDVVKASNIYVEFVSAESAPDAPPISVPTTDLKFRFRAKSITGVTDGNRFTPWVDDVVGGDDAEALVGGTPTPSVGPIYRAAGMPNGDPGVDFDTIGKHFEFDHHLTTGVITEYIAAQIIQGNGSSSDWWLNGSLLDAKQFSLSGKHGVTVRADGRITCGWAGTSAITAASYITGAVEVFCYQREPVSGDFALYDKTGALIASGTGATGGIVGAYAMLGMNYVTLDNVGMRAKYAEVIGYEGLHDATQRLAILTALTDEHA